MEKSEKLLTAEQIKLGIATAALPNLPTLIIESVKDVELIKVDTKDKLPIANARLGTINELLKHIEKERKALKAPVLQTGKDIEAYANQLKTPLEQAKRNLNAKILGFKKAQEAEISIEHDEKKRQEDEKKKRKIWEVNLLDRIRQQINARLFGGQYVTGNGTVIPTLPAKSVQEVTEIYLKLVQDFPTAQFQLMSKEAETTLKELSDMVLNHQKQIASLIKEGMLEKAVADKRHSAENDRIIAQATSEDVIAKQEAKVERDIAKEAKETTKGVRKTIDYSVENIADVPVTLLSIDPVKVNEYIKNNKQLILNGINKEKQESPVPGIRFYEHSTYVAK